MENKEIFYIVLGFVFVLVNIFIAICSSTILLILICNWQTKCRSISNLLVVNSCVAFLVFVFIFSTEIPLLFHNNEQLTRDPYTIFCRIRGFLLLFSCIVKVCSYLIQAISRFFITILYKYRCLLTYRMNKIMIILSWLFSLIVSVSFFISPISFQYESESHLCLLTSKVFHTSFTLMMIAFVIPVTIIICLYGIILHHTTRANRIQPTNNTIRNHKRDVKVFQNILLLFAIVIFGGTPYLSSILINKFAQTPWPFYSISILFIALSTAVEIVTIFLTNKEVKAILYTIISFRPARKTQIMRLAPLGTVLTNPIRTNIK